jgi:hypothetical protein
MNCTALRINNQIMRSSPPPSFASPARSRGNMVPRHLVQCRHQACHADGTDILSQILTSRAVLPVLLHAIKAGPSACHPYTPQLSEWVARGRSYLEQASATKNKVLGPQVSRLLSPVGCARLAYKNWDVRPPETPEPVRSANITPHSPFEGVAPSLSFLHQQFSLQYFLAPRALDSYTPTWYPKPSYSP